MVLPIAPVATIPMFPLASRGKEKAFFVQILQLVFDLATMWQGQRTVFELPVQQQSKFHLTPFAFPDRPILSHLLNQHLGAGFFFAEADYGDVALVLVPGLDDDVALVVEGSVVVVVVFGDLVVVVYGVFVVVVDDGVVADVL